MWLVLVMETNHTRQHLVSQPSQDDITTISCRSEPLYIWQGQSPAAISIVAFPAAITCSEGMENSITLKVVNMGTAISETKSMDKWAASKRTQVSAILCIKLLPLLENALKLNFKALYETENLDPLQGPTHTDPIINTHTKQAQKLRMDLPPALLTCRLQPKTHSHSDSPSLHSISQNSSLLKKKKSVQTNLQGTARPHQSTDLKLERAASRIKERSPPCLFRLPPWENVNR